MVSSFKRYFSYSAALLGTIYMSFNSSALAVEISDISKKLQSKPCDRTVEVFHRSQNLVSHPQALEVSFESIYRRLGNRNNQCRVLPKVETPIQKINISKNGQKKTFDLTSKFGKGFFQLTPISYSSNRDLLIVESATAWEGGDVSTGLMMLNLETQKIDHIPCESNVCIFEGFLKDGTVVVGEYGMRGNKNYRVFSTKTLRQWKLPSGNHSVTKYGAVMDKAEIVKVQSFKRS